MQFVPFLICLIIYLGMTFYGLKLRNVLLSLILFYVGYSISNVLLTNVINNSNLLLVFNVGIGLILGSFATKLYKFSTFLVCFLLVFMICVDAFDSNILKYGLGTVLGIIFGYFGMKFVKIIVISITSLYGAYNVINLVFNYFNFNNLIIGIILYILIVVIAINYQFKTNKDN